MSICIHTCIHIFMRVFWSQQGQRYVAWCNPAVLYARAPYPHHASKVHSLVCREISMGQCSIKTQPGLQMPNSQQQTMPATKSSVPLSAPAGPHQATKR